MNTSAKIINICLWTISLLASMVILLLPAIFGGDSLSADFTTLQHQGIYLPNSTDLRETDFMPGDRIIRINGCAIETHLSGDCDVETAPESIIYDLIRNNQVISIQTSMPESIWSTIGPNFIGMVGVVILVMAGLVILCNLNKVRWYLHLLIILSLFGMIFAFETIKLPLILFLHPVAFWIYQVVFIITQTTLRAVVLNLVLVYPQHRFNKKKTRQIILGILLVLPPLVLLGSFLTANNVFSGIRHEYEWLDFYSAGMLGFILFTLLYHIGNAKRPIVNLRLRWLRIGAITILVMIAGFVLFLFAFSNDIFQTLEITFSDVLKVFSHPFTLLLVTLPLLYAIPLGEQYPDKIDNLENRILFYLVLSVILMLAYGFMMAVFARFDFYLLLNDPYTYFGLLLTVFVVFGFALLRSPIDRFINGWFYRDRLKYQTLLPGFILELNSNLSQAQLRQLLLSKLPSDFDLVSTMLLLRDPDGESFSIVTAEEKLSPTQFSKNHPLIQHFLTTHKPILRFLDQKTLNAGIIAVMEKMDVEAAIPLTHNGNLVGIYFLRRKTNGKPFTISELKILNELDEWAGTAVYNTWVVSEKEDYSRSLEMEMEEQSRELDRVVDETRKYQRTTQQKAQQKESIIGQIHEDIRQPLQNISSYVMELCDQEGIEGEKAALLQQETSILAARLGTFLDYSAVQNAKFQQKIDDCDLTKLFRQISTELESEFPAVRERVRFHIDALTPITIKVDRTRFSQILMILIQITLERFPDQAFLVSCAIDHPAKFRAGDSVSLSILCKSQPDAIILQQLEVEIDQAHLKMELVNQLLQRMDGELLTNPLSANFDFPFHFHLNVTVPDDSYPVYMGVDLPYLKAKSLVIFDAEAESRKQLVLQTTSWGMNVTAVATYDELLSITDNNTPDLVLLINHSSSVPESWKQSLDTTIRVAVYHFAENTPDDDDQSPSKSLLPQRLYSLITKSLLFLTTTQYPHIPRKLDLPSPAIAAKKQVLLVGESGNASLLTHYFSRFNLETTHYLEKLDQLPDYLNKFHADILLFELATKEQQEWEIIRSIKQQGAPSPFLIAICANPIRFPALDVLKAGADKYVLKPYQLEELLMMIAEWLNHATNELGAGDNHLL